MTEDTLEALLRAIRDMDAAMKEASGAIRRKDKGYDAAEMLNAVRQTHAEAVRNAIMKLKGEKG